MKAYLIRILVFVVVGTVFQVFFIDKPYYTVTFYSGDYGGIRTHYNVFHKPIKTLYCVDACGVDDDAEWATKPDTLKTVEITFP